MDVVVGLSSYMYPKLPTCRNKQVHGKSRDLVPGVLFRSCFFHPPFTSHIVCSFFVFFFFFSFGHGHRIALEGKLIVKTKTRVSNGRAISPFAVKPRILRLPRTLRHVSIPFPPALPLYSE
jgi:hypothetical protein